MAIDVYREWLKIASPERPPDHYILLGLKRFDDDRKAIESSYRQRTTHVRRYASGKFSKESQDLLDELARAMLTLTDPGRKNEYDRKLGRKTKRPPLEKRPMAQILLDDKLITADQLKTAQGLADELGIELRQALVQKQMVSWEDATRALAQQHNLPYMDLADQKIPAELIEKVPVEIAQRENLVPLLIDQECLFVAVTYALNLEALEVLRFRVGMPVRAVLCSPPAIRELVEKHYSDRREAEPSQARGADTVPDEPAMPKLSLAGWLWQNVKWLALLLAAVGGTIGYFVFDLMGALIGAIVTLTLLAVALFTAK